MSAKFVICLAICALAAVSVNAGVLPLAAAPLAAAGVVAPYATSYNAHTVNHAVAAPLVAAAAAAPVVAAAPAAKLVAAPAAYAAAPFGYPYGFPAAAAYTAYPGFPAGYVL